MLNSKYSKVLTIILIIAIVIIVGLLVFIGIDWYKAYTVGKDTQNSLDQFNSYIENNQNNDNNANFEVCIFSFVINILMVLSKRDAIPKLEVQTEVLLLSFRWK